MQKFVTGGFKHTKPKTGVHYSRYKKVTKKALFFAIKVNFNIC